MVPYLENGYLYRPTGAPITFSCENAACFLVSMQRNATESGEPIEKLDEDIVTATDGVAIYNIPAAYDGYAFNFANVKAFQSEEDLLAYIDNAEAEVEMTASEAFGSCSFEVHAASEAIGSQIETDFVDGAYLKVGDEISMMCEGANVFQIFYTTQADPDDIDAGMGYNEPIYIDAEDPGFATWAVPEYLEGKCIVVNSVNAYGNRYDEFYASEDAEESGDPNINALAHATSLSLNYTLTVELTPHLGETITMAPYLENGYLYRPTGAPVTFSCENAACFLVSMQRNATESGEPIEKLDEDIVTATDGVAIYNIPAAYDGYTFNFANVKAFQSEEDLLAYIDYAEAEVEMTASEAFGSCSFEVHAASEAIGSQIETDFVDGAYLKVGDEISMMCEGANVFQIFYTTQANPDDIDAGMGYDEPIYIDAEEPGVATWTVPEYLEGKCIVINSVDAYGNRYDEFYASEDAEESGDPNINVLAHAASLSLNYTLTITNLTVDPESGSELVAGEDAISFLWFNVNAIKVLYEYHPAGSNESEEDDPDAGMDVDVNFFSLALNNAGYGEWTVPAGMGEGSLVLIGAYGYRDAEPAEDAEPVCHQSFGDEGHVFTIAAAPISAESIVTFSQEGLEYTSDNGYACTWTAANGKQFSTTASVGDGKDCYPKVVDGSLRIYKTDLNAITVHAPAGYRIVSATLHNVDDAAPACVTFNGTDVAGLAATAEDAAGAVYSWTPAAPVSHFSFNCNSDLNTEAQYNFSGVDLELTEISTGVEVVTTPDPESEVEYYNLQGVRVVNPARGLYIKRTGHTVSKVVI